MRAALLGLCLGLVHCSLLFPFAAERGDAGVPVDGAAPDGGGADGGGADGGAGCGEPDAGPEGSCEPVEVVESDHGANDFALVVDRNVSSTLVFADADGVLSYAVADPNEGSFTSPALVRDEDGPVQGTLLGLVASPGLASLAYTTAGDLVLIEIAGDAWSTRTQLLGTESEVRAAALAWTPQPKPTLAIAYAAAGGLWYVERPGEVLPETVDDDSSADGPVVRWADLEDPDDGAAILYRRQSGLVLALRRADGWESFPIDGQATSGYDMLVIRGGGPGVLVVASWTDDGLDLRRGLYDEWRGDAVDPTRIWSGPSDARRRVALTHGGGTTHIVFSPEGAQVHRATATNTTASDPVFVAPGRRPDVIVSDDGRLTLAWLARDAVAGPRCANLVHYTHCP